MSKPNLDIIRSPTAERMINMVTQGFYNDSFTGLWMWEIIGREYGDMAAWSEQLKYEIFPQTCTWSIAIWEWVYEIEPDDTLTLEVRRGRLMAKRRESAPINPARIEALLSLLSGVPVRITENVAPYTFRVIIDESDRAVDNHTAVLKLLRTIKPSHLSFTYEVIIIREYTATDYYAAGMAEFTRELFIEETEMPTDTENYSAGAVAEYERGYMIEETELITDGAEWSAGTIFENTKDIHIEETEIQTDITDYDSGASYINIREQIWEEIPIENTAASYNGGAASEITKEEYTE